MCVLVFLVNHSFFSAVCSTFASGIFVLFGGVKSVSISAFSRTFHLPLVTIGSHGYENSSHASNDLYTVFMRPLYEEAMMDIIRYYSWKHILYIYDSTEGEHCFFFCMFCYTCCDLSIRYNSVMACDVCDSSRSEWQP